MCILRVHLRKTHVRFLFLLRNIQLSHCAGQACSTWLTGWSSCGGSGRILGHASKLLETPKLSSVCNKTHTHTQHFSNLCSHDMIGNDWLEKMSGVTDSFLKIIIHPSIFQHPMRQLLDKVDGFVSTVLRPTTILKIPKQSSGNEIVYSQLTD